MKEGSEGDGGGSSDDIPTSRDADSTVSNGGIRMGIAPSALAVHEGLPLGGTTLANALLGIALDRGSTNGTNTGSNGDSLLGIHSTNVKGVKGNGDNGQNRDKVFVCNICNRCFGYKHVLQNHERTHTGEKPFECKECHKRFTRDHHLKTHMRLHTGEKPYHCSHCERQFVQVANLRRHLRVHTGERPYACTLCSSRFSDSNQLKAHVLIHEGIKPFECKVCGGHFRRRHHLVHHKCPKDEANIGKPRRGRRPKAYDDIPIPTLLSPVLQERLSTPIPDLPPPPPPPVAVSLTSVITRGPSPSIMPQPAHMQQHQARRSHHQIMHHQLLGLAATNGGGRYHLDTTIQTGPLDMTVSAASTAVSVIVPRIPHAAYHIRPSSMDGVLDLSNSRSDSEAEPIEEEVDEDEDCIDEGLDSDSEEEDHIRLIARTWNNHHHRQQPQENHLLNNMHHLHHHHLNNNNNNHMEDLRRGNGDRYDSEGDHSHLGQDTRDTGHLLASQDF